jgi:predicted  nucleic acid-binding Zn-ribbon protein
LKRFIDEREKELLYQIDKYKSKLGTLRKELKGKEKDYEDLKTCHSKFEREKREQVSEREELRVQVTRVTEEYQTALAKKDNDFYV